MVEPSRTEIRITGFGGQGVVLAAHIIGDACAIRSGLHASMLQSFGPEARGSACTSTLVVSDAEVLYPYVRRPDILVAMSADGYEKYASELDGRSLLIHESELVHPELPPDIPTFGIPSTRIAESLGRTIVQNIVMVGFFAAVAGVVTAEAMREAVLDSVPAGTEELNLAAFERGLEFGQQLLSGSASAAGLQEAPS